MCNFGYLKIHAKQSEAENIFKEVSEIVIFRTISGGWLGSGGTKALWPPGSATGVSYENASYGTILLVFGLVLLSDDWYLIISILIMAFTLIFSFF